MIPKRSEYSGQSYRLFTDYNDVHIFVEDGGFENLYNEIFRRTELKIRKVFSKNGKNSVIEAAKQCKDPKCIYIIDRDWDDFHKRIPSLASLIVLEKHSIENYLIEYSGFRALVLANNPRCNIESLFSPKIFNTITEKVSNCLRPLFECFLTMQINNSDQLNCSIKPGSFQIENSTCAPDPDKISTFIKDTGLTIPQRVSNYFAGDVLCNYGHGKYMLHFIWAGVRSDFVKRKLSQDALLISLAQTINIQVFASLSEQIIQTAKKRCQK